MISILTADFKVPGKPSLQSLWIGLFLIAGLSSSAFSQSSMESYPSDPVAPESILSETPDAETPLAEDNGMDVFMKELTSSMGGDTVDAPSRSAPESEMNSSSSGSESNQDSGTMTEANLDQESGSTPVSLESSSSSQPMSMDSSSGKKETSRSKEVSISITKNKYKMYVSFDLPEGDMFNAKNLSAQQCIELCNDDAQCTAVTYDRWNKYCFAKNVGRSSGRLYVQAKSDTYVLEKETRNVSSSSSRIEIKRRKGKGFTGTPQYTASGVSYEQCKTSCGQDNKCVAFNHIPKQRVCEFFYQPPEYFSKNGYQIGVKQQVR